MLKFFSFLNKNYVLPLNIILLRRVGIEYRIASQINCVGLRLLTTID